MNLISEGKNVFYLYHFLLNKGVSSTFRIRDLDMTYYQFDKSKNRLAELGFVEFTLNGQGWKYKVNKLPKKESGEKLPDDYEKLIRNKSRTAVEIANDSINKLCRIIYRNDDKLESGERHLVIRSQKTQDNNLTELEKECYNIYYNFHKDQTSVEPKIDGRQLKSLKKLVSYIKNQTKSGDEEGAKTSLKMIFDLWPYLDDFYKKKIRIDEIERNISNIMFQIKKVYKQKKNERKERVTAEDFSS